LTADLPATKQRYLDHIAPKDLIDTMQARDWAL
jgi:hypothetical protein